MAHWHARSMISETSMRKFLIFAAVIAAGVALVVKMQRERELDEAVWEEPRDL